MQDEENQEEKACVRKREEREKQEDDSRGSNGSLPQAGKRCGILLKELAEIEDKEEGNNEDEVVLNAAGPSDIKSEDDCSQDRKEGQEEHYTDTSVEPEDPSNGQSYCWSHDGSLMKLASEMDEPMNSALSDSDEDLPPPDYVGCHQYSSLDTHLKGQTECKLPFEAGLCEESAGVSDDTEVKEINSSPNHQSDEEVSEQVDLTTLMDMVSKLMKEQEQLKALSQKHDEHLEYLIKTQPSVRRRLTKKGRSLPTVPARQSGRCDDQETIPTHDYVDETPSHRPVHCPTDYVYVQIEKLYANFSKMHLIRDRRNAGNSTMVLYEATSASGQRPSESGRLPNDNSSSPPRYTNISESTDAANLIKMNKILQQKVEKLEKELRERKTSAGRYGNSNSGFTSNMPETRPEPCRNLFYNERQQNLTRPTTSAKEMYHRPAPPNPPDYTPVRIHASEVSFDWVISDYHNRLKAAKSRSKSPEVSGNFYIKHIGYRGQIELYLNGNGTAENRCWSVFLRVIKGEFDRYLPWPAHLTFNIILVNQLQTGLEHSTKMTLKHDYRRPTGASKIDSESYGLVEFVTHSQVYKPGFIKNGSIKLRFTFMM